MGNGKEGIGLPKLPFASGWVRQLLLQRIGNRQPNVGVFVTDLMTGATVEINPDKSFKVGSVAKISVAMTVLHLATQGRISLDDMVTYQAATDYAGGAGSLRYWIQDGQQVSVRYLLDRMIRVSDNIAWNMLERYVGAETVNQYILSLGVQTPYTATEPRMTPRDTNTLLLRLDGLRAGISPELTRWLIELMATTVYRDRIPAKLPPDVYVAEKVGTLADVVHDVGLVYAPQRSFAISVLTEQIPANEAVDLIADLAARVYWYEDWLVREGGP
jgi:beta-lactamase class A